MSTQTTYYNLQKPTVGGDDSLWGPMLNSNADTIDATMHANATYGVPLAGGTMTGLLVLSADPTALLGAATKQYVDSHAGLSDAPSDGFYYARVNATWGKVAPLASPNFTGVPTAPTAAVDTSTTQLATCGFVIGQASAATPNMSGTAAVGTSTRYARADHTHPSDTSRAPLASPVFTGVVSYVRATAVVPTTVTATGATTVNYQNGEVQKISLTGNATLSVSNWPASGNFAKLVLDIVNTGAFNITAWPTGTIWAGAAGAPTITSGSGKHDVIVLTTLDGGTTILGNIVGQNFA